MNKKQQMLYLSGLISEDKLAESSDFEQSMASVQKMQIEFNKLQEMILDCSESCEVLRKQAQSHHAFHDKSGAERIDSNGIGDAQYFEDVSYTLGVLDMSIKKLYGHKKPLDEVKTSFEDLITRLNTDFDPV